MPTLLASVVAIGALVAVSMYNPQPTAATTPGPASVLTAVSPISNDLLFASTSGYTSVVNGSSSPAQMASAISVAGAATTSAALTTTQKLAQDLFSQYMTEAQGGGSLTDDQENQIIQSTLLNDVPSLQAKVYSRSDLIVNNDESAIAIKNYGNALGTVFSANGIPIQDNELAIMDEALSGNNSSDLKNIDLAITAYSKMITGLLAIPVPESAVSVQLDVMNGLSEAIASDQELKTLFTDPALSMIGIQHYEQSSGDVVSAFTNLNQYFKGNGVVFSQSDPGNFLSNLVIQ